MVIIVQYILMHPKFIYSLLLKVQLYSLTLGYYF